MRDEIAAAVVFLTRLLKRNKNITNEQVDKFADQLSAILLERFKNHWHIEVPIKGQGYRCIRINDCDPIDPVLLKAAHHSGLEFHDLYLPSEITLWVDPQEVSCRVGETKSSFCTVATVKDGKLDNRAAKVDIEDLIREHNRKKEDDLNKLKEFTSERRSPTLYPGEFFMDSTLQYQPSGEVHKPLPGMGYGGGGMGFGGGGSRWGGGPGGLKTYNVHHQNGNHHNNHHHHHQNHMRRPSPPNSSSSSTTTSTTTNNSNSSSRNRSPGTHSGSSNNGGGVLNNMKTGGHRQGSPQNKQYSWTNKSATPAPPTKA